MIRDHRYPLRPLILGVLAVLLSASMTPALADPKPAEPTLEETVAALEERVRQLEIFLAANLGYGDEDSTATALISQELRLPAKVTRKHFEAKDPAHARWEDYVQIDLEYDTTVLTKPAIALKGTLEFADPFGELRFSLPTQVNDNIKPGKSLRHKGVAFEFNQFHDAHKWVLGTEPKKMVVALRLTAVMYKDGTTEEFR